MATLSSKTIYTISQLAREFKKTHGRISQLVTDHNLAQQVTDRLRVVDQAGHDWLETYFKENGRNFSKAS